MSAIEAELPFSTRLGQASYSFQLIPAASDTLLFGEEKLEANSEFRSTRGHEDRPDEARTRLPPSRPGQSATFVDDHFAINGGALHHLTATRLPSDEFRH
jgi:hypothetical protein